MLFFSYQEKEEGGLEENVPGKGVEYGGDEF